MTAEELHAILATAEALQRQLAVAAVQAELLNTQLQVLRGADTVIPAGGATDAASTVFRKHHFMEGSPDGDQTQQVSQPQRGRPHQGRARRS